MDSVQKKKKTYIEGSKLKSYFFLDKIIQFFLLFGYFPQG